MVFTIGKHFINNSLILTTCEVGIIIIKPILQIRMLSHKVTEYLVEGHMASFSQKCILFFLDNHT